jgi:hypothetical protein
MKTLRNVLGTALSLMFFELGALGAGYLAINLYIRVGISTGMAAVGFFILATFVMAIAVILFLVVGWFFSSYLHPDKYIFSEIIEVMKKEGNYKFSIENNILKVSNDNESYYMMPDGNKCGAYIRASYNSECQKCKFFDYCKETGEIK